MATKKSVTPDKTANVDSPKVASPALADWQKSNNPSPEEQRRADEEFAKKREEMRKSY